ncbi:MAG TPA: MerR family transcriptional regulator [Acidimicrobiia bacterium]
MSATESSGPVHLSIGEVLSHLRDEFPDVTISKIRFLESQGLIDPERTPSGYRKFYDADVARLRWILFQQKEHFLPLKVIKERLEQFDRDGELPSAAGEPEVEDDAGAGTAGGELASLDAPPRVEQISLAEEPPPEGARSVSSGGVSLTRAELARAADLEEAQVAELESFGLLAPATQSGDHVLFDEEGLTIAKLAAGFYQFGFEARHLRMYKHFADREAALFEQRLLGLLRQRNPEARAKAKAELGELARLGRGLRSALLVTTLREALAD